MVIGEDGWTAAAKARITPADNFRSGFFNSIGAAAAELGLDPTQALQRALRISHGSTVATNIMVQGSGAGGPDHDEGPRRPSRSVLGAEEHLRGRVAGEERHSVRSGRLLRWAYRLVVPITAVLAEQALRWSARQRTHQPGGDR